MASQVLVTPTNTLLRLSKVVQSSLAMASAKPETVMMFVSGKSEQSSNTAQSWMFVEAPGARENGCTPGQLKADRTGSLIVIPVRATSPLLRTTTEKVT